MRNLSRVILFNLGYTKQLLLFPLFHQYFTEQKMNTIVLSLTVGNRNVSLDILYRDLKIGNKNDRS